MTALTSRAPLLDELRVRRVRRVRGNTQARPETLVGNRGGWDDGDGAGGAVQEGLADRAEEKAGEAAAASGSHDDQLGVGRRADQLLRGVADHLDQFGATVVYGR